MCVLRARGRNFEVDSFLTSSAIRPCKVCRRGEPRLPTSQPDGPKHEYSGFHADVSTRAWDELSAQIEDAKDFVIKHRIELERLRGSFGVTDLEIDFPTNLRIGKNNIVVQSDSFPADLLLAVGALGIDLTLTIYPLEDDTEADGTG